MDHHAIKTEWEELAKMAEATRPTTDHPEAHAFLDALKKHAEEQAAFMAKQIAAKGK